MEVQVCKIARWSLSTFTSLLCVLYLLTFQLLCAKHCKVAKPHRGGGSSVGQIATVGHGVQQVVRKGAGAIQQLMGQRWVEPIKVCVFCQSQSQMFVLEVVFLWCSH